MRLAVCLRVFVVLLASTAHARQLQQKGKEEKPVYCLGPPPPFANMLGSGWPADCKDNPLGFGCKGTCAMGFTGQPTAVCQGKKGAWATNGACKPAKCDAINLPFVANATWGSCDGLTVGQKCTAKCDGYFVESAAIEVTCEPATKGATWSSTEEFCGTLNTQALLRIEAATPAGTCDADATKAVKDSVVDFMSSQTGVNELNVAVTCFDKDGNPQTNARRLLDDPPTVSYVVVVIYVGTDAAAEILVRTAEADLDNVGNLIQNVAAATENAFTVKQEGTVGDYQGGGETPVQDAKISLMRSSPGQNLQTGAKFFLIASYTGTTGFAQEGVTITGPTITPGGAVTCEPIASAPMTNALGTFTWACQAGPNSHEVVSIAVEAPNPHGSTDVSASVTLAIGTDCVGAFDEDFGACNNACGAGEKYKFYHITTEAANGGRLCPYNAGDNITETCTGPTQCSECQSCSSNACVNLAAGTACSNIGKCYDGICQAGTQLFEVKSVRKATDFLPTVPFNGTEWTWSRLGTVTADNGAVGQIVSLATEVGRTTPAAVTSAIVETAPADPRTPGANVTSALLLVTPTGSSSAAAADQAEAQIWYRNNTQEHPIGLFNGMKFSDFIAGNGKMRFSWYRGAWPAMTQYAVPSLRFSVINPNSGPQIEPKFPLAAFAGTAGFRIEFVWEPFRQTGSAVPVNGWVTEEISLNQGKMWVRLGKYSESLIGAAQINCYEPISYWIDSTATCGGKQHPWFRADLGPTYFGTTADYNIVNDGIIWEVRLGNYNSKTLSYVQNFEVSTNDGHKFEYVFTN